MINILKKLIPFTRLTLNTSLPSEIVMQRLAENIKHVQLLGIALFSSNKRYTGIIEGNTFNLIRFIRYRNSLFDIVNGSVIKGVFPSKQLRLVLAWCEIHRDELKANWDKAQTHQDIKKVDPLV